METLSSDNTGPGSPSLLQSLESLVGDAQRDDPEAFASIVERFQDMAVGYAYSKLRDMEVAEEIAQEAFLRAFLGLYILREPKPRMVATPTGFEPAISGLTGRYVKPLHHGAADGERTTGPLSEF